MKNHLQLFRGRLLLILAITGCGDKELPPEDQVDAWEADGFSVTCWPLEDIDEGSGECPETIENSCCNTSEAPPVLVDEECCYPFEEGACCGRPMVVDGVARVAPRVARTDWGRTEKPAPAGICDASLAWLAGQWAQEASLEHASVASFARFTLDLMAFGAPPELLAAAQHAGLDEVAHARMCFAIAARLGGQPVGPGPLDMTGVRVSESLPQAAATAVSEACVGETIAALEASVRAAQATDAEVRAALVQIAEDEARHAELGWRFVRWALTQDAAVRPAVEAAFAEAFNQTTSQRASPVPDALQRRLGRLPSAESRTLRADALAQVLAPCRDRLLAAPDLPRRAA